MRGSLRRLLRARVEALRRRPALFQEYIEMLANLLDDVACIIVFGGRARVGLDSVEPRDYDVLIVASDRFSAEVLEVLAAATRPRGLPLDLLAVSIEDVASNPLIAAMLREALVIHDGLGVCKLIVEGLRGCTSSRGEAAEGRHVDPRTGH